ncbi:hypothetical protein NDU88_001509 [Pleurodeles waltl]|uniref:Uncharacterized protein n=1 Tax=Pleurodeles waltl TaxID=8319 RepID=A0AAV7R877_PLEWA|nr:hypothetical protein NDU88_001509 [Pleurodeles waltl]
MQLRKPRRIRGRAQTRKEATGPDHRSKGSPASSAARHKKGNRQHKSQKPPQRRPEKRQEGHPSSQARRAPRHSTKGRTNQGNPEKEKSGRVAAARDTQEPKPTGSRPKQCRVAARSWGSPQHRSPCHTKTRQRAATEPEWKGKRSSQGHYRQPVGILNHYHRSEPGTSKHQPEHDPEAKQKQGNNATGGKNHQ